MHRLIIIALLATLTGTTAAAEDYTAELAQSRAAVKAFAGSLKGALQAAIKAGGPANAIAVCHDEAPQIAAATSEQTGLQIGRTSLKIRNPDNSPDAWEQAVLEQFEQRQAAGEAVAKLEFHEVVDMDGQPTFRYMKAIPAAQVCLACHGDAISEKVSDRLSELYPYDQARGFKEGEIRGAFTVAKPR